MLSSALNWFILTIPCLVIVAFFTLMERKVLGLAQSRKGPNKVSVLGILQPFADAIKLFLKEISFPFWSWKFIFFISPVAALALALWLLSSLEWLHRSAENKYNAITLLMILSLGLYPLLLAGWSSNSSYATIGAMRGVAQTISYEISMALFLLSFLALVSGFQWKNFQEFSSYYWVVFSLFLGVAGWLVCAIAESNRTPFDFAEGESELVSGFNIEYAGGPFACIFMAEYAAILGLSALTLMVASAGKVGLFSAVMVIILTVFWVWLRATLPRFRYDKLMNIAWIFLLPLSLSLIMALLPAFFW